jgi:phosphocarrier protein
MQERQIIIVNRLGLHARAAAKFVTLASSFSSEVDISKDGQTVNGKSIMGVMMLAASRGSNLVITTRGEDEQEAADQLEKLVREKFGEVE